MNNALWSPRGAQARERTHAAGYTTVNSLGFVKESMGTLEVCLIQTETYTTVQCTLYSSVSTSGLAVRESHMHNDLPGGTVLSSPTDVTPTLWEQNDHK